MKCKWVKDDCDPYYESDCGMAFVFNDGDCNENEFTFCPKCGNHIDEVIIKESSDE